MKDTVKENEILVTAHAYDRLKERNNWNHKAARRMAGKAFTTGKDLKNASGCLKNWYLNRPERDRGTTYMKYGADIYVYRDGFLITAFHTPNFKKAPEGYQRIHENLKDWEYTMYA